MVIIIIIEAEPCQPLCSSSTSSLQDETPTADEDIEVLVFVTRAHSGKVLLMHRCREHGAFWHGVSGGVEAGESVDAAAARELAEEIGLEARQLLATADRMTYEYERPRESSPADSSIVVVHCYRVVVGEEFTPVLNDEHDRFEWCEPERAGRLLKWANAASALAVLLA